MIIFNLLAIGYSMSCAEEDNQITLGTVLMEFSASGMSAEIRLMAMCSTLP